MSDEDQRIKEAIRKGLVNGSPFEQAQQAKLEELEKFSENAYEKWIKELSREIKEDNATKAIGLLTSLSAYCNDPQNFMMKGDSSIGKTWNATKVTIYFPPEDLWSLGGLSPTALVHEHGVLEHAETGDPLDEDWVWNQMDEWDEANPEDEAKSKSEHKRARQKKIRYLKKEWKNTPKKRVVNLNHKILLFLEAPHIETFNRLRPILSHDQWEITYKFTDRSKGKGLSTVTVVLRGWPSTIFCTTDLTFLNDLATRSFTATPTTTVKKLEAALLLIGEKESMPWLFEEDYGEDFRKYIRALKGELMSGWKPIIPFAYLLAEKTSPSIGRDMRDFKHLLTLVKMVALLHFYIRPKITVSGRKYVLATMEDFKIVLGLWKDIEETTRSGLSGEEITLYNCLLKLETHLSHVRQSDLVDEYNKEQTKKIATPTAYKYLSNLCDIGYVDKKKDDRDKDVFPDADGRYNLYWSLKNPRNAISKAWEYFPSSFTLKELENWFIGLLNHYPEKQLLINVKNESGKMKNLTLTLNEEDEIDKKQVIKNLFSGYYYSEPTEPETAPDSQEKLPKYSHGETPTFEGISDASLQEKTGWILGQLSTGEKLPEELAEFSGMTLTEVDKILAYMNRGKNPPIHRAGKYWRKS